MGRDLVSDHPLLHIFAIGQTEVFLRRHIAQHGRSTPTSQRRANGTGDVVVARRDIGHQRAQHIERGALADLDLPLDVHVDLVHRNVARPLDHALSAERPATFDQAAQDIQFGELSRVAGVGNRPRTQPISQTPGHVILTHDRAQIIEMLEQRILLAMSHHPLGDQRTTAAHDSRNSIRRQMEMFQQHAAVDRHVVHTLLRLMLDHLQETLRSHILDGAAQFLQHLIDRHSANGHRRSGDDRRPDGVNILAGGQIHDRVRSEVHRRMQLLQLFRHIAGHCGIANIGVDFASHGNADAHGLQTALQVDLVRGDHQSSRGYFVAN